MTDSIIKTAFNTGLACGTPVATMAFIGTPGFIADDIALGTSAAVLCGVGSLFGLNLKDAVVKGWYGVEDVAKTISLPTSIEEVLKSANTCSLSDEPSTALVTYVATPVVKNTFNASNVAQNTCDLINNFATNATKAVVPQSVDFNVNCDALSLTTSTNICPSLVEKTVDSTWTAMAQNTLVSGFGLARMVKDCVANNYSNYVGAYLPAPVDQALCTLGSSPVFMLKAAYNVTYAFRKGQSAKLALVDTAMSGAVSLATKAGVEMFSNVTGVSSAYLELPAQVVSQVLYSKAKSAVVFGYNAFVEARAAKVAAAKVAAEKAAAEKAAAEKAAAEKAAAEENVLEIPVPNAETGGLKKSPSQENLLKAAKDVSDAMKTAVDVVKLQETATVNNGRTFNGVSY